MLTYQQIVDYVLIDSGQFFDTLEASMLDEHKMEMIINKQLQYFNRYKPKRRKIEVELDLITEFTVAKHGYVPDHISSIRYANYSSSPNVAMLLFGGALRAKGSAVSTTSYRYEKPTLYLRGTPGVYEVSMVLDHYYDKLNKEIRTMDDSDHDFLDLVTANFMIALGRSRRAFSIGEIPFNMDSDALVSEGMQLRDSIRDRIETTSDFHLAIGP